MQEEGLSKAQLWAADLARIQEQLLEVARKNYAEQRETAEARGGAFDMPTW